MLETNRKKANNRNEMSDIELVFKPGVFLPIVLYFFLFDLGITSVTRMDSAAPITMM